MYLISFLFFLWLPAHIHAVCCPKVPIKFTIVNKDVKICKDFGGHSPYAKGSGKEGVGGSTSEMAGNYLSGNCAIEICGDGKPPQGTYCGRGSCNFLGCNCDYGCISGDPKEEFLKIHGDEIRGATYENLNILKYHKKNCCIKLFDYKKWGGESTEICDCDENCVNLPDEWKNRISSATLKTSNNLILYSEEDCNGKELKVPGSTGIVTGSTCRRDLSDDSFFGGCSTSELNDNAKSLKILHRSAFASYVSIIL